MSSRHRRSEGQLTRTLKWSPLGLWALIGVQYATAEAIGNPVSALHPVVGMLIFGAGVLLAIKAWRAL